MAPDKFLHQDLGVHLRSRLKACRKLCRIQCLGNAAGGASLGGLYEYGIGQLLLHLCDNGAHVLQLSAADAHKLCLTDPKAVYDELRVELVHGHGGSQDTAAHIGDPCQLQKALDRSVFSKLAVKDRPRHIQMHIRHLSVRLRNDHTLPGGIGADLGADLGLGPASVLKGFQLLRIHPSALFGDTDENDIPEASVDLGDHIVG